MPSQSPGQSRRKQAPRPRERRGNVIPIEGWSEPMRCPQCAGERVVQVDMVECAYPVSGVRRPWCVVELDADDPEVDAAAIGEQFYRCEDCEREWPVEPGTLFIESKHGKARVR